MLLVTATGGFLCHCCYGTFGGGGEETGIGTRRPKDDNAWQKIHLVLQVDSSNPVAREGMKSIIFYRAGRYLARAEWVSPRERTVATVLARLNARRVRMFGTHTALAPTSDAMTMAPLGWGRESPRLGRFGRAPRAPAWG